MKTAAVTLLLAVCASIGYAQESSNAYFPLKEGNRWAFVRQSDGVVVEMRVTKVERGSTFLVTGFPGTASEVALNRIGSTVKIRDKGTWKTLIKVDAAAGTSYKAGGSVLKYPEATVLQRGRGWTLSNPAWQLDREFINLSFNYGSGEPGPLRAMLLNTILGPVRFTTVSGGRAEEYSLAWAILSKSLYYSDEVRATEGMPGAFVSMGLFGSLGKWTTIRTTYDFRGQRIPFVSRRTVQYEQWMAVQAAKMANK